MSIILQLSLGIVLSIVSPIHNNHEPTSDEKIIFTDEFEQESRHPRYNCLETLPVWQQRVGATL